MRRPATATAPTPTPTPAVVLPHGGDGVLTYASYGDSLSAGDANGIPEFEDLDASYWQDGAAEIPAELVGGWAAVGAPSAGVAENAEPAPGDWAVVLMGTNDLAGELVPDWVSWRTVFETSGADRMLVLAIPPLEGFEQEAADLNLWLETKAESEGFAFFDPWAPLRAADGLAWRGDASDDGIHPVTRELHDVGVRIGHELARLTPRP